MSVRLSSGKYKLVKPRLRTMHILFFAIWAGMFTFGVIVIYMLRTEQVSARPEASGILQIIALIFTGSMLMVSILTRLYLPQLLTCALKPQEFLQRFLTIFIIVMALCDGPAFFSLVIIIIGGEPALMFLLFGVSALGQALHFPTRSRLENLYRTVQEKQQLNQLG